jgi:hypothetical protein
MNITESAKTILMGIRPCNKMRKVITELAIKDGINLTSNEGHMRIDNEPYQRLCIEKIDSKLVSVAHYFEMNGYLVPDPDMVFLMLDKRWYPIGFQNQIAYEDSVRYNNDGQVVKILDSMKLLVPFTSSWDDNIIAQGYLDAVKPEENEDAE